VGIEIEQQNQSKKWRKRKNDAIVARRAAIAERYKQCWTLERIAKDLGVSIGTVSEDIHALLADLKRTAGMDVNARIAIELDKINLLENEAWESLKTSRQPKFVSSASETHTPMKDDTGAIMLDAQGKPIVTIERRSSASEIKRPEGDPRFMMIINQCITRRMKLFGLEGGPDEEDEKKNKANTFSEWVAAHLAEREKNAVNVTPKQKQLTTGGA